MVVLTFDPLGKQRQVDLWEFKASLVYKESSRATRAVTQRNPVSEKKERRKKKKKRIEKKKEKE